jgi:hypothetical protein
MEEGQTTAWPDGGGEDRCSLDMQKREEGNSPYQGPSGTSGEITGHREMRIILCLQFLAVIQCAFSLQYLS